MSLSEVFKDIPKIQDADLKNKIVLVRVDHNVVKKGRIPDPFRIDATLGTLFHILSKGGKLILMTHVGRPYDKSTGKIKMQAEHYSIKPIVDYFEHKLHTKFIVPDFLEDKKDGGYIGIDTGINLLIKRLRNGEIDGIYLPNTRWFKGEEKTDLSSEKMGEQLAGLADVFVNDAFGSWQPHTSTMKVTEHLPSYAGFLMQQEILNLSRIFNPEKPMVGIVAGAKFDTKIGPLNSLIEQVDYLILGGIIYNAYISAKYNIKIKGVRDEDLEVARKFLEEQNHNLHKIIDLPYVIESDTLDKVEGKYRVVNLNDLNPGDSLNYVLDVSYESYQDDRFQEVIKNAKTIFVNAVMGKCPDFENGTRYLYALIDENKNANKLYGGGDTLQEFRILLPGIYIQALDDPSYYFFSGGGTILEAIESGTVTGLAPVRALIRNKKMRNN